jgi:hypothetical protein
MDIHCCFLSSQLLQYGGFKVPFLAVGGFVLVFILPCTLLVKEKGECFNFWRGRGVGKGEGGGKDLGMGGMITC